MGNVDVVWVDAAGFHSSFGILATIMCLIKYFDLVLSKQFAGRSGPFTIDSFLQLSSVSWSLNKAVKIEPCYRWMLISDSLRCIWSPFISS